MTDALTSHGSPPSATTVTPDADLPEFVLVHGAWHGAWAFDELGSRIDRAGLRWRAVDLPSAGSTADLAADAAIVRSALGERAVPTVLVGHSYGGIVISEAAAGVDHVRALVYLSAFMLDAGESLLSAQGYEVPDWIAVDEQAGVSTVPAPSEFFYQDCPREVADAAAARLVPQSLAAFADSQTAAAWREHPSTYVICEQDHAIPPAAQEAMSARAATVERLDRSHSPFLSAPDELLPILRRAAQSALTTA